MRFIKLAIYSVIVLFVLTTCIGLLFPSRVVVSRSVVVNRPADSVLLQVLNLHNWSLWMDGVKENGLKPVKGNGSAKGSEITIGTTRITVTAREASQLSTVWTSPNGYKQSSGLACVPDTTGKHTTVHWYFEQQVGWFPWERFGSMMNDKILGPTMEKSLDNLRQLQEQP